MPRRELPVARQMLRHDRRRRDEHEGVLDEPFDVIAGLVLATAATENCARAVPARSRLGVGDCRIGTVLVARRQGGPD